MLRPPPISTRTHTPCPYTTLFRSPPYMLLIRNDEFDRPFRLLLQSALVASGHDDENKFLAYKPRTPTQRATILPLGFSGDVSPALRDRKSTRLNSSH